LEVYGVKKSFHLHQSGKCLRNDVQKNNYSQTPVKI